jgi:hypothetical protein
MAKHHTIQTKYLVQWQNNSNQLNIYLIPENKFIERGASWKGFWKKDFNVFTEEKDKFYLPEKITALIDSKGIESIRNIDNKKQKQLNGWERSCIAFYVALQYIRTPRHREEADKFMEAIIKYFMRKDASSLNKIKISKEEILKHNPANKFEKDALEKINTMSDAEIKKQTFQFLHSNGYKIKLTNTGHSKDILKIERLAKGLFNVQWLFLSAPKDSFFTTSDNPCFTLSPTKIMNGLLSPNAIVFFPLRPDLCIAIKPKIESKTEHFLRLDKKKVKKINQLILANSYQCFIAKYKRQLENLIENFDYKNHRKSRDVAVKESGNYVMFNVE